MRPSDYPVLEVHNVSQTYGQREVLAGVSLTLSKKSVLCLIGESGCGKSTLLRIIAGLETPAAGVVVIGGHDASGIPTSKRNLGFVFQDDSALFQHLTVRQNIEFPFRHGGRRLANGDWREAVNEIIAETGLRGHAQQSIKELSGGLRQRLAIARALVYQPALLLLDEPLSSLDNPRKDELMLLVKDLRKNTDAAFLYVTHDDREVRELADRVAVLHEGQIVREGELQQVLEDPQSNVVCRLLKIRDCVEADTGIEDTGQEAN